MATVNFLAGSTRDDDWVGQYPVIAIDLGFAEKAKSCGIAWRDSQESLRAVCLEFGASIKKMCCLLKGHTKAVLIIEAPLSCAFTKDGNPIARGTFERQSIMGPKGEQTRTRFWYSGPGAAMCLAAIFFLKELEKELQRNHNMNGVEITLFEGFVSFKSKKRPSKHLEDAQRLVDAYVSGDTIYIQPIVANNDKTVQSVLDIMREAGSSSGTPSVICPPQPAQQHQTTSPSSSR